MSHTTIEWALNPDGSPGYTLNPISGCLNHTPEGLCLGGLFPCYAWKLAHTRLKQLYLTNTEGIAGRRTMTGSELNRALNDPFWPRIWPERMEQIRLLHYDRKSKGIFPCDMGDLFGDGVPEDWTNEILDMIQASSQHRFYLLTKKPENLPHFNPFSNNAWIGATATNTDMLLNAINCLEEVKAQVKYISLEPLLSWADTSKWVYPLADSLKGLSWIIIGACTGTYPELIALKQRYPGLEIRRCGPNRYVAVPPPDAVREIITAADAANIRVFIKNNILDNAQGDYRLTEGRREMPHGDE